MADPIFPLLLFALSGSLTPGPNNLMVTASGTAFGFARTIPHMLGVTIGFGVMILAFGLGLAQLFASFPDTHRWVRLIGAAYLLYLAARLALAGDPGTAAARRRPLNFFEAGLFQWVNPKAWTLALGVVAAFTTVGSQVTGELAVISLIFMLTTLPSLALWCWFGVAIGRLLASARARRLINFTMAGLVALSVILLFI